MKTFKVTSHCICRKSSWLLVGLSLLAAGGCTSQQKAAPDAPASQYSSPQHPAGSIPASSAPMPNLPSGTLLEKGVMLYEVPLDMGGDARKLWVYLPENIPAGTKLPCVLIAPAGTRLFHGMKLGEGDRPEHLPYVRAGFAVVAYDLSGPIDNLNSDAAVVKGAKDFYAAQAGLVDARAALDYIQQQIPQIDSQKIYSAGHSSAGTLSLLLAENEPRIKACVAYAPIVDLPKRLGDEFIKDIGPLIAPDYRDFITRSSPAQNVARLKVPTFIFHAADDDRSKTEDINPFVANLQTSNNQVTFVNVPSGGHYDSMIQVGVPQAIAWLKKLP